MAAPTRACVLAAGKGTRMGGDRPKVLFEAGGRPLIEWVLSALSAAGVTEVVAVVGYQKDEVTAKLPTGIRWVEQSPQLGTGHAVMCARSAFQDGDGPIVVTCGDMPLLRSESFRAVCATREAEDAACALLTTRIRPESRFGRIVRDPDGRVRGIVEYKDATEQQRAIDEGNTGVMCFRADALWSALDAVTNDNAQGEYYLTDVIGILLARGERVTACVCEDMDEALGVNTPDDLRRVEEVLKERETA